MFVRPYDPDAALFNWLNGVRDWLEANRTGPLFVYVINPIRVSLNCLVTLVTGGAHGDRLDWRDGHRRGPRPRVRHVADRAAGGGRVHPHRAARPVDRHDGHARADARGGGHCAGRRDPARRPRRQERPVPAAGDPVARPDADHADVRLPAAADAVLPDRPRHGGGRDADLLDPAGDPHHVARHPGRVERDRGGRAYRWARRTARCWARCSCRWPGRRSAWPSTRRS